MSGVIQASTSGRAPLLLVDDDPGILRVLSLALRGCGYRVETANGVTDALQRLRHGTFSMAISDYQMVDGTGLDLLDQALHLQPELPFILLTANSDVELAREALARGAIDFLAKPVDVRDLNRILEQNWQRREVERLKLSALTHEVLTGTIYALVAAVDAKDPFTATHSERVTQLALRLGQAVGLDGEALRALEFAALLHDVGKIGVPTAILTKPGKLTPEEWAIIRTHPGRSQEIISRVPALVEMGVIARHHHERFDGQGYPDGLSGEAIPYLSRVICVADCYEAMTADRSYRAAMPVEKARQIIREGIHTQFDPDLAEVFLRIEDLP